MSEPTEATDPTPAEPFRITEPGFYQLTAAQYHADPCPTPSLSSSIAYLLCHDSAARAQFRHPRLNPTMVREEGEGLDLGTAAHLIVLEGTSARIRVITGVSDWRTKAAQELRNNCRSDGFLPILEKYWSEVLSMTTALRAQLDAHVDGRWMFVDGQSEVGVFWQEEINGGVIWCRALIDYLRDDGIDDYKTTRVEGGANPEKVSKSIAQGPQLLQAAFYQRGVQVLTGLQRPFRFAYQELCAPYLVSVNALGPDLQMLGEKQVQYAIEQWQRCLARGEFPGYDRRTAFASLPPWVEEAWLRKEVEYGV